jgi:hypothetical protein
MKNSNSAAGTFKMEKKKLDQRNKFSILIFFFLEKVKKNLLIFDKVSKLSN